MNSVRQFHGLDTTIGQVVVQAKERLGSAAPAIDDALHEAKLMVSHVLGVDFTKLYLNWEYPFGEKERQVLDTLIEKRIAGKPLQYVLGTAAFWDCHFQVGPGVLIPRPETERLVEAFLSRTADGVPAKVAELGAGSGCIGISICRERAQVDWHAFELSNEAMKYLEANRQRLASRLSNYRIHAGDFFALASQGAPFDWIVSNPPYVGEEEMLDLPGDVRQEPTLALNGGRQGLEIIRRLIEVASQLLTARGRVLLEIGHGQGKAVLEMLEHHGFTSIELLHDFCGKERVAYGELPCRH